jgi:hypothetical protein
LEFLDTKFLSFVKLDNLDENHVTILKYNVLHQLQKVKFLMFLRILENLVKLIFLVQHKVILSHFFSIYFEFQKLLLEKVWNLKKQLKLSLHLENQLDLSSEK